MRFWNPFRYWPPMPEPFTSSADTDLGASVQAAYLPGLRYVPQGTRTPHDGVIYRSRGAVLVIGASLAAAEAARELARRAPRLRIALFAPGSGALKDLPPSIRAVGGRIVSLQGCLGNFSASVRVAQDKVEDAGIFSGNADRRFDLVLDLGREPLLRHSALPYGYYAPGDDAAALVYALESLPQLVGDFHQPTCVDYHPPLCTHGAMGVTGCTRCVDACDAVAIHSTGDRIEVNAYLCQGCAGCTLACPTGALELLHPAPRTLQEKLDDLLAARTKDARPYFLVVHDAASRHLLPAVDASEVFLLEVNPLPAFSDLMCLSALLAGARGIVLVVEPAARPRSRGLIERKVDELREILSSLGGDPLRLQIASPLTVGHAIGEIRRARHSPEPAAAGKGRPAGEKRACFLALADACAASWPTGTREPFALPAGAAFGNVVVDAAKCTLCHACTHLCPTAALRGQRDPELALFFQESLCVQCDLCRAGCPEKAIVLEPRFQPDADLRAAAREIARDQRVACSSCGTPFIGHRQLAASLALMAEHAQDLPGGIDSLRLCPACRQRETLSA